MGYFDMELKTTIIFSVLGIIIGYVSFLLNSNLQSFFLMIVVAIVFVFVMKRVFKIGQDYKWWLSNGAVVYIFLWLITWIIFYNVALR